MAHRRREGSQPRSAGSNRRSQKVNRYQQTQKGPGSQLRSPGLFACLTCWLLLYSLLYGFLCRSLLRRCCLCRGLLCCSFCRCSFLRSDSLLRRCGLFGGSGLFGRSGFLGRRCCLLGDGLCLDRRCRDRRRRHAYGRLGFLGCRGVARHGRRRQCEDRRILCAVAAKAEVEFFLFFFVAVESALVVVGGHRDLFFFVIVVEAVGEIVVAVVGIIVKGIVICSSCIELDRIVEHHLHFPWLLFTSHHCIDSFVTSFDVT